MSLSRPNRIALLGGIIGVASAVFLSLLVLKPNRLAPGQGVRAFEVGLEAGLVFLLSPLLVLVVAWTPRTWRGPALAVLGGLAMLFEALLIGSGATRLVGDSEIARVSVGSSGWLGLLVAAITLFAAARDLEASRRSIRVALLGFGPLAAIVVMLAGGLADLSVTREYAVQTQAFWNRTLEHVGLASAALLLSSLIGLPLGVFAARSPRLERVVIAISSALQTIPSLALLTLLIAPFSALARAFPGLEALGVRGIGPAPGLTALTLYGLLPIVRGALTGLRAVPAASLEAARGMGMTEAQRFWRVQVPLASPLVLAGLRVGAVSLVGLAAVASLVGAGGLGFFIFAGLGGAALDLVLLGAIPVLVLAVLTDALWRTLEAALVPRGARGGA